MRKDYVVKPSCRGDLKVHAASSFPWTPSAFTLEKVKGQRGERGKDQGQGGIRERYRREQAQATHAALCKLSCSLKDSTKEGLALAAEKIDAQYGEPLEA